ncbi:hypothetical protein [Parabacteroides sp. ZJ-118]|uniref:hypothetical protein n=1 Tax=Parabacteroides sp. ZJ-118 TaxID=2709398 RepID=UPI0013EA572B|nr:hypothetical protein [Parabacteroides sp. ZJ-118]
MNNQKSNTREGQKQKLVLYMPDRAKMRECKHFMDMCTVNQLLPKFKQLKALLETQECVLMTEGGERDIPLELRKMLNKKGNPYKGELLDFLAFFMADSRNFGAYFHLLPRRQQQLWTLLVRNYFASNDLQKRETGVSWISFSKKSYFGYRDVEVSSDIPWFEAFRVDRPYPQDPEYYLYIPRFLRPFLYPFFFPEAQGKLDVSVALPEGEALTTFTGERKILELLPVLDTFYRQGLLDVGKNGKLGAMVLNKVSKLLCVDEFFPGTADKMASSLYKSMLLNSYVQYRTFVKKEESPELFIKNMITFFTSNRSFLLSMALPHINGIRSTMMCDTYVCELTSCIMALLASMDSACWGTVESLRMRLYFSEPGFCYNVLFNYYVLGRANFTNSKQGKELIILDEIYEEMSVPFIKGFLFLLASLGLVEIAYGDYDPDSCSYCDSLRYFRLTALGQYVLGIKKEYRLELNENVGFEVDEDNLIIRSVRERNPYESLMADIAEQISAHRYKVSYESFLKNCADASDVEKKIDFFRMHVCQRPPQIWEDFFLNLQRRSMLFQEVLSKRYVIYRLDAEDKDLLRLVSSDKYLRQYSLRAESYLLLVDSLHLREVKNRLKELGYLI